MAVMIKALFFRHKMETAVLVLPVATMIAFAQLRGSMPDAPARFGASVCSPVVFSIDGLYFSKRYQYRLANIYYFNFLKRK